MPTAANNLRIDSSGEERSKAISDCISQLHDEQPGVADDKAQAICIDQANKAMGTRASGDESF